MVVPRQLVYLPFPFIEFEKLNRRRVGQSCPILTATNPEHPEIGQKAVFLQKIMFKDFAIGLCLDERTHALRVTNPFKKITTLDRVEAIIRNLLT